VSKGVLVIVLCERKFKAKRAHHISTSPPATMQEAKEEPGSRATASAAKIHESYNFDSEALSSRYSTEVESEQQRQAEEEDEGEGHQQGQDDPEEDNDLEPDISITEEKSVGSLFLARDSFHNPDQTVNLMDVNAANYDADDGDLETKTKLNKPPGKGSSFMEALMGEESEKKAGSGWNKVPQADKPRLTTWDTSFIGRLAIWLIFFGTMVLVTFVIPYLLMKDNIVTVPVSSRSAGRSRMDDIKTVILQNVISTEQVLDNTASNAYYALQWLSDSDPAQVQPMVNYHDNTELLQRFALATLYYSTHSGVHAQLHSEGAPAGDAVEHMPAHSDELLTPGGFSEVMEGLAQEVHLTGHPGTPPPTQQPATDASISIVSQKERDGSIVHIMNNPNQGNGNSDRRVWRRSNLRLLSDENSHSGWIQDEKWMTSASVCEWYGVTCAASADGASHRPVVVQLNLTSNNLTGTVSAELRALSKLATLDLSHNGLTGIIPAALWANLPLQIFKANQNKISGSLPSDVGLMTNLEELDLSKNSLVFELPSELARLRKLRVLSVEGNRLSGNIPSLLNSTNLSKIWLHTPYPSLNEQLKQ
jgi:hypothetical protein